MHSLAFRYSSFVIRYSSFARMDRTQLCQEIIAMAMAMGASSAEVLVKEGKSFSTSVRLGSIDKLVQANFQKLGVRVFAGNRAAISASSDFSLSGLRVLISDTLDMARVASEDPAAGIPPHDLYQELAPRLELSFPRDGELGTEEKIAIARECEEASLRFDPRITNSEGASFSDSISHMTYSNSLAVSESYSKTLFSLESSPLAEMNGQKQRDQWLSTALDFSNLQSPAEVGKEAARRAVRRLGARKVSTREVPVVFDPRASANLLYYLAEAVSGSVICRKASFLVDKIGARVASPRVTIYDDARLPGGLGSRPFDSEGVPSQTTTVVEDGILMSYLLDSYSARKLQLRSTSNSARSLSGGPTVGPSNFYLKPGMQSAEGIVSSVKNGLYVTELLGFGVNIVSGDFSQGAMGIWIENGELAFPVEEITIAGNLKEMLAAIEAVGNDPLPLAEVFSPTIMIGKMIVGGN